MTASRLEGVVLRPVTPTDNVFLLALYAEIRAAELDQVAWPPGQREAFLRMQHDLQDAQYRAAHPDATFDIIEVDGVSAGRLYVSRRAEDIRIVDVALIATFRGRGIGGALVSRVIEEAEATGRVTSIHVEVHNPAARLYQRLGFRPVARRGVYVLMERAASGEGGLVEQSLGTRTERYEEEVERPQGVMAELPGRLSQRAIGRAGEGERELVTLLPGRSRASGVAGQLDLRQHEDDGIAGIDLDGEPLALKAGEVVVPEPSIRAHAPILRRTS